MTASDIILPEKALPVSEGTPSLPKKSPKIRLVALNSSYSHTCLAVRCLNQSLQSAGFDSDYAEFHLKDRRGRVLSSLLAADADIYGFSAYIWNIRELLQFASDIKKLRPKSLIVFGGPEVSFDTGERLNRYPFIDCILVGEGEQAVVTLAEAYRNGERIPPVIDGGIDTDFTSGHAGILYKPSELSGERRMLYYESSRGCPFRCAYCLSALSGNVRAKSASLTLDELYRFETLSADIRVIKFVDRTFNFDRERAKAIWRGLLDDKYTKCYHFEICAELLDEESFGILSQFPVGKVQLEIGVQSVNEAVLKRVSRHTDLPKLLSAIDRLYSFGNMHIHTDLIAGLPGEDFTSFGRSFDALWGHCDMLQLGFLKLLRGSVLRQEADSFGCIWSDEPPYEVLATDSISYEELAKLHVMDTLNERLCGGGFTRTMRYLLPREVSAFSLFCRLAESFDADGVSVADISQPRFYAEIYRRVKNPSDSERQNILAGQTAVEQAVTGHTAVRGTVGKRPFDSRTIDNHTLACLLSLDFLTSQNTSLSELDGYTLIRRENPSLRRLYIDWAEKRHTVYFAPALEVREDSFDGTLYILDRKNKCVCRYHRDADGNHDFCRV